MFAVWVENVASHNEKFSEALRDAADIMAMVDPTIATGLYRAADTAYATVNALRTSMPVVPPEPAPQPNRIAVAGRLLYALVVRVIQSL